MLTGNIHSQEKRKHHPQTTRFSGISDHVNGGVTSEKKSEHIFQNTSRRRVNWSPLGPAASLHPLGEEQTHICCTTDTLTNHKKSQGTLQHICSNPHFSPPILQALKTWTDPRRERERETHTKAKHRTAWSKWSKISPAILLLVVSSAEESFSGYSGKASKPDKHFCQ